MLFRSMGIAVAMSACNSQVEDYIRAAKPDRITSPTSEITVNSPMSIKMTPGKINGSASDMVVQGTITITNQTYAMGSDKAVSLTLSRTRVLPQ